MKVDVSLGGSYLDSADPALSGWTVVGGAGVSVRRDRSQLAARYERSRYQALVLGRNQTVDLVYASFGRTLTRRLYLAGYGYYRNAHDPVNDIYSYDSATAGSLPLGQDQEARRSGAELLLPALPHAGLPVRRPLAGDRLRELHPHGQVRCPQRGGVRRSIT